MVWFYLCRNQCCAKPSNRKHAGYCSNCNASRSNNITFKNCNQTNLGFDANGNYVSEVFKEDGSIIDGVTVIQANTEYNIGGKTRKFWGIMGSNYSKNLTYDGCKLSRFDAHAGVYNATIKNSDITIAISITGAGTFTLENSRVYGQYLTLLRSDYGATWHGDFVIKNTVFYSRSSTATLFGVSWNEKSYGYQCYMPTNITIDGLTLKGATTAYLFPSSSTQKWTKDMWTNATNSYIPPKTITIKNSTGTYYVARYGGVLGFIGGVSQSNHYFGGTTISGASWKAV